MAIVTADAIAKYQGNPVAKSDAKEIMLVDLGELEKIPSERFAFDHYRILTDYLREQK